FSSRRRHTRWPRDWSSDVCSSDLYLDLNSLLLHLEVKITQANGTALSTTAGEDSAKISPSNNFLHSLFSQVSVYLNETNHAKRRSEEHTSELQSRGHLVCRLLLEK